MASPVSSWRSSSPETVDDDLAALWRDIGREAPVSLALMSNLIIVRRSPGTDSGEFAGAYRERVGELAQRHPVRAILLDFAPAAQLSAPIAVEVGVLTYGTAAARYGVELIAVQATCAEASIPSIVGRVLRGDVPTSVWWIGDLSQAPPPRALTTIARQLVYSSTEWRSVADGFRSIVAELDQPHAPDIVDLNWRRLAPLRHALVHALSSEPRAQQPQPIRVDIQYVSQHAALAWLVGGWLRSRIGAATEVRLTEGVRLKADTTYGDESDVVFGFSRTANPELVVSIEGDGWKVVASMQTDRVAVTSSEQAPFEQPLLLESDAEAVAAELHSLGHDTLLQASARAAAVLSQ